MNRYIIAGILGDMRVGRQVVLLSKDRLRTREAFLATAHWLDSEERAVRTSGFERCESADGKGWIRFLPITGPTRGLHADVVVVDLDPSPRQTTEVLSMVDMRGEVICL